MRKKNTLYTVNKWNQPLFMSENKNLFWDGGSDAGNVAAYKANYTGGNYDIGNGSGNFNTGNTSEEGGGGSGWQAMAAAGASSIPSGEMNFAGHYYRRGAFDAADPLYYMAGERESAVGNTLSDLGIQAVQSGNPWAALGGAALKITGDFINAAWGIKTDKGRKELVDRSIAQNRNFYSNASSFDDLQSIGPRINTEGIFGGGWFTGGKAAQMNKDIAAANDDAYSFAERSLDNNVYNIGKENMNSLLRKWKAYGGPIETRKENDDMKNNIFYSGGPLFGAPVNNVTGVLDYDLALNKQNIDSMKIQGQSANKMQAPLFMNSYDLGGDIQMHGGDFTTGLIHIDAGQSHEQNPNDGVQMGIDNEGTPNLVEENETVWNDYVFSARILADDETKSKFHLPKKKDITYAEISKKLEKEIAERPNDAISRAGFEAQMQTLEEQQERQKAEMEAARAREAFEALSPEEQTAVMQNAAQQEQMAQQAAQEQAMAEQQAMQQATPEELAMAQQAQMQADGSQAAVGQEAPMMAYGGKANKFDLGGEIMKMLGKHTWSDFVKWAKENKAFDDSADENSSFWDGVDGPDKLDWNVMLKNESFRKALSKDNPALAHALKNEYDFGAYVPDTSGNVTFKDISKGNWTAQDYEGWKDSQDPAWLEAVKKGLVKEGMKQEDIAKALRQTDSYKRGSKWLQDSEDNRLRYLRTILEDDYSPEVAKNYARKFIDENGWKKGAARDYESIFGANGKGVRETHPGTYWHTPVEAVRGAQTKNYVINDDGNVEEIIGDVPTDWTAAGNYSWATPENDLTYNYYRRPVAAAPEEAKTPEQKAVEEEPEREIVPDLKRETSIGMFGPAVGLGLQLAGVGKPDTGAYDAAVSGVGNVRYADYQPIGNYLTYRPLDIWYQQNALNAQSRATDRALLNTSSPSRAAGVLANGYNSQLASGNLFRQAQEYNDALQQKVEEFNRGTNQFNAEAYNRNSQFNADAYNTANRASAQMKLHAAQAKDDANRWLASNLYGNINGLFDNINQWEKWKRDHNTVAKMYANGLAGTITEDNPMGVGMVKTTKAKGGNIKKKKRGLTI